jgi:hypothetical protein
MPQELIAQKTQVSVEDVFYNLAYAWVQLFNEQPTKESLLVLLAQSSLETGRYKSIYNLGNVKSIKNDGYDFTYYKCNEVLTISTAKRLIANQEKDGGKVSVVKYNDDQLTCTVSFEPKHPVCCFKAFTSLEDGARFYLGFLYKKYNKAWKSVLLGNPDLFCRILKVLKYYTADEGQYTKSVVSLYKEFSKLSLDLSWLLLSELDKQNISNNVSISLQNLANDLTK